MYSVYLDYPNLLLPSKKLTMPSIGLFFFFLGLVVASVKANETTTAPSTVNYTLNSITSVTRTTSTNNVTGTMNTTQGSSTSLPSTTMQHSGASSKSANETPSPVPTTKSNGLSKRTTTAKTNKDKNITAKPDKSISDDRTGIIILVVIILVAFGFGVACFLVRKRGRSYSVDHTSRQDEANIPLSTMDPELRIDAVSQNGLQTFESTEKDLHEPEAKPEVQEVQTAEADKPVVDPSAESAAPAPTPDGSEDKPKEDVVEQSPPAPVTLSVEEKTDDEGVVSNQNSVESLKEANENNSNNADFSQTRDMKGIVNLWDVPLNCPV